MGNLRIHMFITFLLNKIIHCNQLHIADRDLDSAGEKLTFFIFSCIKCVKYSHAWRDSFTVLTIYDAMKILRLHCQRIIRSVAFI